MGLFDNRIAYKPFEYPEYYTEGWLKQAQAFWLHTEIPMSGDVKDWNENLTPEEKNLVGNILLGFAQTECAVSDYWTQKVVGWFPKHEIQQMAMMFVLYSFQMRNLLKGVGQQMKWSVRDESLHSKMGCQLFNHMCDEDPNLRSTCRDSIKDAAETMVELEENYIDKMFEMGDIEGIKSYDLKQFIRKRCNEKLRELGYDEVTSRMFVYDKEAASNLDWFYHLTGGHTHTDFFAMRPTDYSKANEGEDFEDIW